MALTRVTKTGNITVDGNVGIETGTVTPRDVGASTLQIGGNGTRSAIKMHTSSSGTGSTDGLFLGYDSGPDFYILNSEANGQVKIGTNNSPGRLVIDSSGYVTTPNQPCFSVVHGTVNSVDARSGYVAFRSISSTYINQGNHFTSSDGRFTAPVAGNYLFGCTLRYDSFTDQYFYVTIKKNDAYGARDLESSTGNYLHASVHVILPMAVNDYVHVGLNSVSDSSIDINSDTHFYGYLLG